MRHTLKMMKASTILLAAVASSCGGGGAAAETDKFVGTWTFESGMLTPVCQIIQAPAPFSLQGLTVSISKIDAGTISLTAGAAGCTVQFTVSGATATAKPGQMCTLDVMALGPQIVGVTSWTLKLNGDRIDSTTSGMVAICTATGSGVLVRRGGDGGLD
jgi:hypothetical protein